MTKKNENDFSIELLKPEYTLCKWIGLTVFLSYQIFLMFYLKSPEFQLEDDNQSMF
jgi:hypothetical protein